MDLIRAALHAAAEREHPVTARRIFYCLVGEKVIEKTEAEYQGTVIRLLGEMREAGELPWHWITDNARWQRRPRAYESLGDALLETAQFYRRRIWAQQESYVEVWCEKVGMSGVLYPVTSKWDVPLMLCGGSPSKTFLYEAAKSIEETAKPTFIYYLGDFDPSGVSIRKRVDRDLRRYAPKADITFVHLAVTEQQIVDYSLPTRPTKKSDPNAKKFGDAESVDIDAMPSNVLREMVSAKIEQHIDKWDYDHVLREEKTDRETLDMLIRNGLNLGGVA